MLNANIKALLAMTRLIVPGMVERKRGHIINIGSIAGDAAYPGGSVYCATKAAVKALSDGLRIDLVDTPLRVTNIKPGLVETNFSVVRFRTNYYFYGRDQPKCGICGICAGSGRSYRQSCIRRDDEKRWQGK